MKQSKGVGCIQGMERYIGMHFSEGSSRGECETEGSVVSLGGDWRAFRGGRTSEEARERERKRERERGKSLIFSLARRECENLE